MLLFLLIRNTTACFFLSLWSHPKHVVYYDHNLYPMCMLHCSCSDGKTARQKKKKEEQDLFFPCQEKILVGNPFVCMLFRGEKKMRMLVNNLAHARGA